MVVFLYWLQCIAIYAMKAYCITFTFSLADAFILSDLQMRTMEAIKIDKRAMICKCYNKTQLNYIKTDGIEKE